MSNTYDRCPNCMNPYDGSGNPCPYCGCDVPSYNSPANALPLFTVLQGKYMIGRVLGQGGFGITYIGYDINLATYVAIKEYYPESIAYRDVEGGGLLVQPQADKQQVYDKNLNRFVEEARNLSKFYSLPGIVSVRNFFYDNQTAYIVMDFVAGMNLKSYLQNCGGKLDEATVLGLMKPVLKSLYEIHKQGLIHRDISPDNIMFDDMGGIKLIDFGSVRGQSVDMDMTYTVMLKHGYAPQEQYFSKGNQGPWTDIYSLCATMYKMLTGSVPPNCIERMSEDTYMPPSACGVEISPDTEKAINKGLNVNIADRYQSIGELLRDLYHEDADVTTYVNEQRQENIVAQETYSSQGQHSVQKKNKKLPIIIVATIVAIAIICVLVKVLFLDRKDSGATTQEPASTTEVVVDTTETTTETSTEMTTEAVTETSTDAALDVSFPGSWKDYKFMIDDTLYQLPMKYEEWTANGWKTDVTDIIIQPGEVRELLCYNDKMECSAVLTNYTNEAVGIEQSYVIGFLFYGDIHGVGERSIITFPGDVVMYTNSSDRSSTKEQIIKAFGEPTDGTENEFVSQFRFFDDNYSNIIVRCEAGGGLYRVTYVCYNPPEGVDMMTSTHVDSVPLNDAYQVPGATADRFDDIFTIDGVNYKISCPVSQFIENGWSLECKADFIEPGLMSEAVLKKGDVSIEVTLANYTVFLLKIGQTYVQDISIKSENCQGMDMTFPGGVKLGMDSNKITQLYSDLEILGYYESDYMGGKEMHAYTYVPDGKILTDYMATQSEDEPEIYYVSEYYYLHNRLSTQADISNTDYILGIMVE